MMGMRGSTRWQATAAGLFVGVPVLAVGALQVLAWQHFNGPSTSDDTDGWVAQERPVRVSRGAQVLITGSTRRPVTPGSSSRISLRFLNTMPSDVILRSVRVRIVRIDAPRADATYPCGPADFRVRQMPARVLELPSDRVASLVDLGVPRRGWPRLTMVNRPVNQDGCKGARLTLAFRSPGAR